jgi:uncharacterized membrane protein YhiD involved in acid resistance
MLNTIFRGVFESGTNSSIQVPQFILCIAVSLIIGVFLAYVHGYKNSSSKSFLMTITLIPAIVCVIIMMVNGNVGAGVAVAGAFSLVRFRSAPGTAREICSLFLAMGAGLITGMGYLGYAVLFTLILGAVMFGLNAADFGKGKSSEFDKSLRVTIPEDINFSEVFDDLFEKYTSKHEVVSVKTSNMGSLYKLHYNISLKKDADVKEFIDEIRCRNGNLEISMSRQEDNGYEL